MMQGAYDLFFELFLSTGISGYLGPLAIVMIGYVVMKRDKFLGVLWFVVECLFISQYLTLVSVTPDYWWQIFLLLIGGMMTCVYPLWDR